MGELCRRICTESDKACKISKNQRVCEKNGVSLGMPGIAQHVFIMKSEVLWKTLKSVLSKSKKIFLVGVVLLKWSIWSMPWVRPDI